MAVVQLQYLTRHVGGAVHMLVFAFIHGVRTSVVLRVSVTSDDARPCPMKNRALTTVVSSSSTCIPCGLGGRGGLGIWVSVAWGLAVLVGRRPFASARALRVLPELACRKTVGSRTRRNDTESCTQWLPPQLREGARKVATIKGLDAVRRVERGGYGYY